MEDLTVRLDKLANRSRRGHLATCWSFLSPTSHEFSKLHGIAWNCAQHNRGNQQNGAKITSPFGNKHLALVVEEGPDVREPRDAWLLRGLLGWLLGRCW